MSDAKNVALKLISAFFGPEEADEQMKTQRLRDASAVAHDLEPIKGGRCSASGGPMEFLAPSVWHAVCSLVSSWILANRNAGTFGASDHLTQSFFGNRPVYRGQSRNWNITPSAWRPQNADIRALKGQPFGVYTRFLTEWLSQANDYGHELFERLADSGNVRAVAQHYGFPTSLVDFTFNPLVALHFALGESDGDKDDYGAVFFGSFVKLCASARYAGLGHHVSFPPIHAQRLYRQFGFFVDFEPVNAEGAKQVDTEAPWTVVEENLAKIMFPREYPDFAEGDRLRIPGLEAPERFYNESLAGLREYCLGDNEFDEEQAYIAALFGTTARPPWIMEQDDTVLGGLILTDDYVAELLNHFLSYLECSALIHMQSGAHLDPFLLASFADSNPTPFLALRSYCRSNVFSQSSREARFDAMITESLRTYRELAERRDETGRNE